MSRDEPLLEQLPPERLLDTRNTDIIAPAIPLMTDSATVEQYLTHERANRDRDGIVHLLTERLRVITETTGKQSPELADSTSEAGVGRYTPSDSTSHDDPDAGSPPKELLALVHDHSPAPATNSGASSISPRWDDL